jgi:CubicO group peptidase (beta-lactamase class C family)
MDNVLKLFDKYVKDTFPKSGIPGAAVVIVQNGQIKYLKCLGVKDLNTKKPVNPNTLFQIGSCSKAFTSTSIAQLVDKGLMSWDDKVKKYYPNTSEFLLKGALTNKVTIRDLLSHRTGLPAYGSGGDQLWISFNYDFPNILYKMRYIQPSAKLRTKFQYNNIMYSLAGESEVKAAKTSWSNLITENILKPLKMNTATTTYQDFIKETNRAHTYSKFYDNYIENSVSNIDSVSPAGSMGVSIKEIANWLNFQLNNGKFQGKQLVSVKSLLETRKPQIAMDGEAGSYYGLGWTINTKRGVINHAGDALPSKTIVEFSPSQKWGIAVFANEGNYGLGFNGALEAAFTQLYKYGKITEDKWPTAKKTGDNLVLQYYLAKKAKPKPPLTPAQNLKTYTGTYSSNLYGNIKVISNGKYLKIYQGNNKQPVTLEHWNGSTFRVVYPITTSSIYSNVAFKSSHGRQAKQVSMAVYYAIKTNGTFKRARG